MKNNLSSFVKRLTGSDSCGICAVAVTFIAVIVIWQVIVMLHGHVQDYVALHDIATWRR